MKKRIYFIKPIEFDPSDLNENQIKFLKENDKNYKIGFNFELDCEINANVWYQEARIYGDPDDCHPEEFDSEFELKFNGVDISDFLTTKQINRIYDDIWENFLEVNYE
jgi:hypothetical protein